MIHTKKPHCRMLLRDESLDIEIPPSPIDSLMSNTRRSLKRSFENCSPEVETQVLSPMVSTKIGQQTHKSTVISNFDSLASNTRGSLLRMVEKEIFSEVSPPN